MDQTLKNKEELQNFLQRIPTADLAEALANRSDVLTMRQRGVHVLMVQQVNNSQTA
jgi:uncharacterized protein YerC